MATLYVRDFPEELYQWLKQVASERRRSIAAEVTTIVEREREEGDATRRHMQALERMAELRRRNPQPPDAEDTLSILRRDRNR